MVIIWEKIRESLGKRLREEYGKVFPLDETLSDERKKAKLVGSGEEVSVYVYDEPKNGENVWIDALIILLAR